MGFEPFTPAERAAIAEVLAHQHAFAPLPPAAPTITERSELHIALDGGGAARLSRQVQPAGGGEMDDAMAAAALSPAGCRIVHNHPNQSSLSASDWNLLANHPAVEMVAVNSRGTTFRGQVLEPGAFISWFAAMSDAYETVSGKWEYAISAWYNQPDQELADFANDNGWLVGFAIGQRLSARGYAAFECVPSGLDAVALSNACAAVAQQLLSAWVVSAIP